MRMAYAFMFLVYFVPNSGLAAGLGLPAVTVAPGPGGSQTYTLSLQVLALMTALTMLPAALMMLTAFTRIIIVLSIVRQAVGMPQAPSAQILIGLSLFLTFFVMAPVFTDVYNNALEPYMEEKIEVKEAFIKAKQPVRKFMMNQIRETDLAMFMDIAKKEPVETLEDVDFSVIMPAFVTSELKTAYQIGFMIFIPFLVIDLVVASVLMAMGMMMLSPMIISLPFKIMLFVLVDGWALIMGTLASSFYA